jgi:hypothetical protein
MEKMGVAGGGAEGFDPDKFLAMTEPTPDVAAPATTLTVPVESAPSAMDKVYPLNQAIDRAAQEHVQRMREGDSPITSGIRAGSEVAMAHINELPGVKQAGELLEKLAQPAVQAIAKGDAAMRAAGMADPLTPVIAGAKALPQPVKDVGAALLNVGSVLPGAAAGGVSAKVAKQALSKTAENVNKLTGRLSEWATGVDEKALRMGGTEEGRKVLEKAFDTQYSIGEELTDILDNVDQYIPERGVVENALQRMPPIRMDKIFGKMD